MKTDISNGGYLIETVCAQCGKIFIITPGWAYKRIINGRRKAFCKYTCMTAFDREFAAKRKAKSRAKEKRQ